MPAFTPKIGSSTLAPYEAIWKRWWRKHSTAGWLALITLTSLLIGLTAYSAWQGQYVPAKGGVVTEGLVGRPNRLNPLFASENLVDAQLTPLLFRGLLKYDGQAMVGDLATSWNKSKDGKTYTLELGNVRWHDGRSITADDVAFTIKLTQNSDYQGPWSKSFTDVKVEVESDKRVRLKLKDAFAPFEQNLSIGILPKHILGDKSIKQIASDPYNIQPIGSGPLKFSSLQLDPQSKLVQEIRLSPTDGYLDAIAFHFYDTTEAMITDFKLGKIQIVGGSYDPAFDELASFPDKRQADIPMTSQSYGLFFNLHHRSMDDTGLRQALAYATPKDKVIADVLNGQAVRLDGVYPRDHWAFSKRAATYDYDTGKADELWDKVDIKPVSIKLLIPDRPLYQKLASLIGQSWQRLGIKVTIVSKDPAKLSEVVNAHDEYDVVLLGEQSDPDPDRYTTWHSTQMPPAGLNITGVSNKRVDKALEDGRKDVTKEDRQKDYDLFQYYLAKEVPVIWLYQPKYIYIWSNRVKGVTVPKMIQEPFNRFSGIDAWYLKTEKRS